MSETDYAIADEVVKIAAEVGRTPTQGSFAVAPSRFLRSRVVTDSSAVCVNWALQQGVTAPVLGTRSLSQLQDCLKSLEFSLTEEQMTRLNAVSKFDLGFPGGSSYQGIVLISHETHSLPKTSSARRRGTTRGSSVAAFSSRQVFFFCYYGETGVHFAQEPLHH